MTEQEILDNKPSPALLMDGDGNLFAATHHSKVLGSFMVQHDGCWYSYCEYSDYFYDEVAQMDLRSISDIETIVALRAEIESLKAQLEAKNKDPSHWDTAPEGAVKLIDCDGQDYYLNADDEYWCSLDCMWLEDIAPQNNILIDERTL